MEDKGYSVGKCKLIAKTPKAILVKTIDFEDKWIPEYAIHEDSELWVEKCVGDIGELVIKKSWLDNL